MNELRMQRGAALCMAVTTLIVIAMVPLSLTAALSIVAAWWIPTSIAVIGIPAVLLMWSALRGTGARIGPLAVALGAANLLALGLYLIAWLGTPTLDGSPPLWSANTAVLPAVVLATVYRPPVSVGYLLASLILLGTAQQYAKRGEFGYVAYINALLTGVMMAVFLVALYAVMDAVRAADARRQQVLRTSARTASRAARIAERERLDEVVRDNVIATLRDAKPGVPDRDHRERAAEALFALDGLDRTDDAAGGTVSAAQTVLRLRETVNAFGDDTLTEIEVVTADARYPGPVVEALLDAVNEAVGNVVAHAGAGASRAVIGVACDDLIRIRIVDDGIGFDVDGTAPDRSGIEIGIVARMAAQRGGSAIVDSTPGEGTTVSLEWRRPR